MVLETTNSGHNVVNISQVVVGFRRDAKVKLRPSEVIVGVQRQAERVPEYLCTCICRRWDFGW